MYPPRLPQVLACRCLGREPSDLNCTALRCAALRRTLGAESRSYAMLALITLWLL